MLQCLCSLKLEPKILENHRRISTPFNRINKLRVVVKYSSRWSNDFNFELLTVSFFQKLRNFFVTIEITLSTLLIIVFHFAVHVSYYNLCTTSTNILQKSNNSFCYVWIWCKMYFPDSRFLLYSIGCEQHLNLKTTRRFSSLFSTRIDPIFEDCSTLCYFIPFTSKLLDLGRFESALVFTKLLV